MYGPHDLGVSTELRSISVPHIDSMAPSQNGMLRQCFVTPLRLTWTWADKSLETWIQPLRPFADCTYRGPPSNTTLESIHMDVKNPAITSPVANPVADWLYDPEHNR
jgi:hypothetical protein